MVAINNSPCHFPRSMSSLGIPFPLIPALRAKLFHPHQQGVPWLWFSVNGCPALRAAFGCAVCSRAVTNDWAPGTSQVWGWLWVPHKNWARG